MNSMTENILYVKFINDMDNLKSVHLALLCVEWNKEFNWIEFIISIISFF